jgi:uncharacterized protein (DUF4415 family)
VPAGAMGASAKGSNVPKPPSRTRIPTGARDAAEAAFKAATAKPPPLVEERPKSQALPNTKELVSLRIDADVLAFFQEEGPGWQDRINAALRKVAGK